MTPRPERSSRAARRAFLGLGGGLAALRAREAEAQIRQPAGNLAPIVFQDVQLKLLRRMTYGATSEDIAALYGAGFDGYVNEQLDPDKIGDAACDARLSVFPTISLPTSQLFPTSSSTITREVTEATILRAIYSKRQLFERMFEFWSDHFNTSINIVNIYKTAEVRDVYRKYCLATFKDMLYASAASPAMILYLNNDRNTRTAPNQNYAREVMELHTLGVNGGYTQADVVQVARCFTGWRYWSQTGDARGGTSYFDLSRHDTGSKLVLGVPIAAGGGVIDGQKVLDILATHPSTATFVSRKLLRWMLSYEPPTTLVADIAGEFTRKNGDIKAVLRRILTYENVLAAPPLFKRPYHLIISALRALRTDVTNPTTVRATYMAGVGETPFTWGPPDGFPHDYVYWGALPMPRWNFAFNLANSNISGAVVNTPTLFAGATTATQIADRIDTLVFNDEMPKADKAALVAYLRPDPPPLSRQRDALGLALASPGFQWH